ncbi:MAG: SpoIIE family protein phosphatase, partial [Bacteroidales bacterium]|nr:SpoIIE family protein phosphatase [Bacteroidales bacterium]
ALPISIDPRRNISYATFTIVDVDCEGEMTVLEYDNPRLFIVRHNQLLMPQRDQLLAEGPGGLKTMHHSRTTLQPGDHVVVVSDGVVQSGMGGAATPFGWELEGLTNYVTGSLQKYPDLSARDLAARIVNHSRANDQMEPTDDISALVFFFRQPRKLLICSGPPYDNGRDSQLAALVNLFEGKKIICGGTTAQIIARELKRNIEVELRAPMFGVPPEATMQGIDMITEGILTLGKLAEVLANGSWETLDKQNPVARMARMILDSDIIELLTGTRINQAHQDPALPMELEIRRNVIKKIANLLEEKYMKEVVVKYM